MRCGRTSGLAFTSGIVTGTTIWGTASYFGLITILKSTSYGIPVFKLVAAVYLFYLSIKALKNIYSSSKKLDRKINESYKSLIDNYKSGLLLHLTNPKALLAWIAPMSIAIHSDTTEKYIIILVISCISVVAFVKVTFTLIFSTKLLSGLYTKYYKHIQVVISLFFLLFSVKMFLGFWNYL